MKPDWQRPNGFNIFEPADCAQARSDKITNTEVKQEKKYKK
jgi:hypothetical protein